MKHAVLVLLFAALNAPTTYRATRGLFGRWVAGADGCPTASGVLLHAAVFAACVALLWRWRVTPESRRGMAESRRGMAESRRGMAESRRGMAESRQGMAESYADGDQILRGALYNRFGMRLHQMDLQTVTWTRGAPMSVEARAAFFGLPEDLRAWVSQTRKTTAPIEITRLAYFTSPRDQRADGANPLANFTYAYARFESQSSGLRGDALWYKPIVCAAGTGGVCTEGAMRVALVYGDPVILPRRP
jgi:hypothetical protein